MRDNQKPLDMLLAASERTHCYFPSPSLLDDRRETLIHTLLPGQQSAREVGRALPVRAMWHLGEGRPMDAWNDLLATHRIARLVAQGQTLIEQLVGMAIDGQACKGTQAILSHAQLTPEQLQQIRKDLDSLPPFQNVAAALDNSERTMILDAIIDLATSGTAAKSMVETLGGESAQMGFSSLGIVSIDWNLVLRDCNEWYDRFAAAAKIANPQDRKAALMKVDADIEAVATGARQPGRIAIAAMSRPQRSRLVGSMLLDQLLPATLAATDAEDRANLRFELIKLAAAIAYHRASTGSHPAQLDELVPTILQKLPNDPYTSAPLIYRRTADGFLLYSRGHNQTDDGASNERENVYAGQPLDWFDSQRAEVLQPQIPQNADDISLLTPTPLFQLPSALPPRIDTDSQ